MEPRASLGRTCEKSAEAKICACGLLASPETEPETLDKLTEREVQVIELLAAGVSNRGISRELEVSERTIKAHITRIFEKLGVQSRVQAALAYIVSRWRACPTLPTVGASAGAAAQQGE
ncbi:response regulator transcription factor [Streptomonospora wellingtoniae]|uniref:Response regulator transcription factor n=1 Tax=Streptomonospora wellingtoniae TaxID=3075544 RepID=A0ABU2KTA9_9ACTN|nr:response regulator transcription factor [Streptomonospora sp. DSM 45055]MDT0302478.1 response regulator transcription factor [Streptomonospora sp. DSM 45055]